MVTRGYSQLGSTVQVVLLEKPCFCKFCESKSWSVAIQGINGFWGSGENKANIVLAKMTIDQIEDELRVLE